MNKSIFTAILAIVIFGIPSVAQQTKNDAVVVTAGYSLPALQKKEMLDGGAIYEEHFHKYDISVGYEKFVWRNLFVMPQVQLWYSNNCNDDLYYNLWLELPDIDFQPDPNHPKEEAWQFGGIVDVMGAWRLSLGESLSLDFLTGPMLNICFASRVKGLGFEYKDFYRTVTFDWRIGLALNIKSHLRIGANLDLRTGRHKKVNTGEKYLYFIPSGEPRRDALNFSVGYRF